MLALVGTTATAERNFSQLACIHTKRRNRLSVEKVQKLSFIRTNYPLVHNLPRLVAGPAAEGIVREELADEEGMGGWADNEEEEDHFPDAVRFQEEHEEEEEAEVDYEDEYVSEPESDEENN